MAKMPWFVGWLVGCLAAYWFWFMAWGLLRLSKHLAHRQLPSVWSMLRTPKNQVGSGGWSTKLFPPETSQSHPCYMGIWVSTFHECTTSGRINKNGNEKEPIYYIQYPEVSFGKDWWPIYVYVFLSGKLGDWKILNECAGKSHLLGSIYPWEHPSGLAYFHLEERMELGFHDLLRQPLAVFQAPAASPEVGAATATRASF